jgi:hypothetical protein
MSKPKIQHPPIICDICGIEFIPTHVGGARCQQRHVECAELAKTFQKEENAKAWLRCLERARKVKQPTKGKK